MRVFFYTFMLVSLKEILRQRASHINIIIKPEHNNSFRNQYIHKNIVLQMYSSFKLYDVHSTFSPLYLFPKTCFFFHKKYNFPPSHPSLISRQKVHYLSLNRLNSFQRSGMQYSRMDMKNCLPKNMIPSWMQSSMKQPPGEHSSCLKYYNFQKNKGSCKKN